MSLLSHSLTGIALAGLIASPLAIAKPGSKGLEFELLGSYSQPDPAAAFDESASEIVAFDKRSERLFVTNGADRTLDILSISNPAMPNLVSSINVADNPAFGAFVGGGANSVAVYKGIVAAAVEADTVTDPGAVVFFDTDGNFLNLVMVGALPDMLTFTPDGETVLVANEGEPDDGVDPEGSVSIISIKDGPASATVRSADFNAFDTSLDTLRAAGVRLFPDVANTPLAAGRISVSQDLEPEYIAVDGKSKVAMVTLQEANALAVVDIKRARVVDILPLGTKDHNIPGAGLDPSDRDGGIAIANWPVRGLYMPDAIASYKVKKDTYYVTANEGDDRGDADESGRGDAIRFKDIEDVVSFGRSGLEPADALAASGLDEDDKLGRLTISSIDGIDADGELAELYSYGARSFTIWDEEGRLVWDSGDLLEQITAAAVPEFFNVSNDENFDDDTGSPAIDNRSDNKGPEPEAITIAKIKGRDYAFVGLERIGGFVVFDISDPKEPEFITYQNNRIFSASNADLAMGMGGDLGPESLLFIDKKDSPEKGSALLVVANEVSGTTSVYRVLELDKSKMSKNNRKSKKSRKSKK